METPEKPARGGATDRIKENLIQAYGITDIWKSRLERKMSTCYQEFIAVKELSALEKDRKCLGGVAEKIIFTQAQRRATYCRTTKFTM